MKRITTICFLLLLFLQSCSPSVKTKLVSGANYSSIENLNEVVVLKENETPPYGSEFIGNLKIGDTGFSTNCDYQKVIATAKTAAAKSGANLILLTKVTAPNIWTSSCYRIKARMYFNKGENMESLLVERAEQNRSRLPADADYAKIYFYRPANYSGSLIHYKIRMDEEEILGEMGNGERFEYTITDFGKHKFWAKTESEESISIEIEKGQEYFVRCGVKMGAVLGRPTLIQVENSTGIKAYQRLD